MSTKILVYENDHKIRKLETQMMTATEQFNRFKTMAETLTKRAVEDNEIIDLQLNGKDFVLSFLRKEFQFPEAGDEFNLSANGKTDDFRNLCKFFDDYSANWQKFRYKAKNGEIQPEKVQPIIEDERVYADTEQKKEILEFAHELVDIWNKGTNLDISIGVRGFVEAFRPLVGSFKPMGKDVEVSIDKHGISSVFRRLDAQERTKKQLATNGNTK